MKTVSEADLSDFIKNKAVQRLRIEQNQSGKYQVIVNLTWKEGDLNLVTTRKNIREWASLDRLAQRIQDIYGTPLAITLSLKNLEPKHK